MATRPLVVLAFSGGLDTSYCVLHLIDQGYDVVTVFADTARAGDAAAEAIEARALELGATRHLTVDVADDLWRTIVVPMVMGGAMYRDRYPLLCSDRYLIAAESVRVAQELGADAIAHGCTAMGNDQVRLDLSIRALTDLPILAPIREIQGRTDTPRAFEIDVLQQRGFSVPADVKRYTINENLLGVTISGGEIDDFKAPASDAWKWTAAPGDRPARPEQFTITFDGGAPAALNGETLDGPTMLRTLNAALGAHGVGRNLYCGDTIVGLKGRIAFECPGLEGLLVAHKALEETVLTSAQNEFKPLAARRWTDLVFAAQYFEPLRADLETFIRATQANVSGDVTIEAVGGSCAAVALDTPHKLVRAGATYAQHADWSAADAVGFITIFGQSMTLGAAAHAGRTAPAARSESCLTTS